MVQEVGGRSKGAGPLWALMRYLGLVVPADIPVLCVLQLLDYRWDGLPCPPAAHSVVPQGCCVAAADPRAALNACFSHCRMGTVS